MAAPAPPRNRTMPLSISTTSPEYSGLRPANGVPGQSPPRFPSALPPPFPPQRISSSSNNHTQHTHTSSDPHYSRSHSRSQPQPPQYQHQYQQQQYDYRYSGSPTVSSPVETTSITSSTTTNSTTLYQPVSGPNHRSRHSSYTPRRATDPPRSAPASRNIRFLPGAGSGNSSPRSPTSPGALPRAPAVNRRHSHDPKRNVYTECGRHSDEWLFGGFSVSGAMRRIWSRESKDQEMEEEEAEERGREL